MLKTQRKMLCLAGLVALLGAAFCQNSAMAQETTYFTISGAVQLANGDPVQGVSLTTEDGLGAGDAQDEAITGPDGTYELLVNETWFGVVTPSKDGYTFIPDSAQFPPASEDRVQNFTASGPTPTPDATPTPTPTPDRDGDGKPDSCETDVIAELTAPGSVATNIELPDSDLDGLLDGEEDPGDCLQIEPQEMTNPRNSDTDGDGILDGIELFLIFSDPRDPEDPGDDPDYEDADNDGAPALFDPDDNNPDTDGDSITDGYELLMDTDPEDAQDVPALGDINDSGSINNLDAIILFNYGLGTIPKPEHIGRADVNGDAVANNLDAIILFNVTLNNIPAVPRY